MARAWAFLRIVFGKHELKAKETAMTTWMFWREALERSLKSAAQGVILGLGMGEGFNLYDTDWRMGLGFAGGAALLSILTSVATSKVGADNSPSAIE